MTTPANSSQYPTNTGPTGAAGITWRGAWSSSTAYIVGDAVSLAGTSYICILGHTNHTPPNATYWNDLADAGNVAGRSTTSLTTGTLTPGQTENSTVTLAKTFALGKIVASDYCRIRLYSTAAARTADATRPSTTQPTIGAQHGVIADLVLDTMDKLTWIMSPLAYGANEETSPSTSISYAITNLSGSTEALTIVFSFTSEET